MGEGPKHTKLSHVENLLEHDGQVFATPGVVSRTRYCAILICQLFGAYCIRRRGRDAFAGSYHPLCSGCLIRKARFGPKSATLETQ